MNKKIDDETYMMNEPEILREVLSDFGIEISSEKAKIVFMYFMFKMIGHGYFAPGEVNEDD